MSSSVLRPLAAGTGASIVLLLAAWNAQGAPGTRQQSDRDQRAVVGGSIPYSVGRALPDRVAGWIRAREIQMFSADSLWEHIDGAADQYLKYGFQDVATSKYTSSAGAVVTADIYRMADAVRAFGIYRQELSPRMRPAAVGVEGRAGSNSLRFWTGSFYVKLTASPGGAGAPALQPLAAAIARGLGTPGSMPPQTRWFPPAGLVPDSVRFLPADALGQAAFLNAFEAKYEKPGGPSTVLVVPFDSAALAAAALAKFEASLAKPRGKAKVTSPGDGGFTATDSQEGLVFAVMAGPNLVISTGAPDERAAVAILTEIVKRLPRAR